MEKMQQLIKQNNFTILPNYQKWLKNKAKRIVFGKRYKVLKLFGLEKLQTTVFGSSQWFYRALTDQGEVLSPELTEKRTLSSKVFDLGLNEQGRKQYITEARVGPVHYKEHGLSSSDPWLDVSTAPANILGLYRVRYPTANFPAFAYRSRDGGDWILVELLGVPAKYDWASHLDTEDRRTWKNVWSGVDVELRVWPDRLGLFKVIKSPLAQHSFTFRVLGERDGKLAKPLAIHTKTGIISGKNVDAAYRDGVSEAKLLVYDKVHVKDLLAWDAKGKTIETVVWGYKDGTRTESIPVQHPDAYPLVLDTDVTEQVPASGDDGYWFSSTFNATASTLFFGRDDVLENSFMRWTTVAVDQGATIDPAEIQFKAGSSESGTTCSTNAYFNNADDAVAPTTAAEANALVLTDATAWTIAAWTQNTWYSTPALTARLQTVVDRPDFESGHAIQAVVKNNGSTNYAFRSPYTYDNAAANAAKLVFAWSAGVSLPTATTQAVSSIQATQATGNGNITDTGGENCDKRGFVYGTTSKTDPGNVAPASSGYDSYAEDSAGGYGTGAFTKTLTSLVKGTLYYVRAYAHNTAGYDYGDEVSFTTTTWINITAGHYWNGSAWLKFWE